MRRIVRVNKRREKMTRVASTRGRYFQIECYNPTNKVINYGRKTRLSPFMPIRTVLQTSSRGNANTES